MVFAIRPTDHAIDAVNEPRRCAHRTHHRRQQSCKPSSVFNRPQAGNERNFTTGTRHCSAAIRLYFSAVLHGALVALAVVCHSIGLLSACVLCEDCSEE
eukprot:COSAG06_NODE_1342_length_9772_cov_4.167819_9_plen_99_part_00